MEFREWLLKEDPDAVVLGDKFTPFDEGITFLILDGLFVYGEEGNTIHWDLASRVMGCAKETESSMEEGNLFHLLKCIESGRVKTAGKPTVRSLDMMKLISEKDIYELRAGHIVQGRIWLKYKVVSFWNPLESCRAEKNHIFNFVREMGGIPEEYKYEAGDVLMDYREFSGSRPIGVRSGFDPSKVHTMLPGPEKTQMMGAMGFMRSKPVDVRTRASREGD